MIILIYSAGIKLRIFFYRVFGGFAKKKDNEENKQKLIDAVGASKVESNFYFVASYDAPWVQNDRHNEIWLLAKN